MTDAGDESKARAILRIDKEKVFRKDARPADYILGRVKALDGVAVEEAVKMEFKDSKGKLKKYKKTDLDCDVGKWLVREIEKESCHTCAARRRQRQQGRATLCGHTAACRPSAGDASRHARCGDRVRPRRQGDTTDWCQHWVV